MALPGGNGVIQTDYVSHSDTQANITVASARVSQFVADLQTNVKSHLGEANWTGPDQQALEVATQILVKANTNIGLALTRFAKNVGLASGAAQAASFQSAGLF